MEKRKEKEGKRNCQPAYLVCRRSNQTIRITQVILKHQEVLTEWYAQSYLLSGFPNTESVMAYNLIVGIVRFQTFSQDTCSPSLLQSS